MGIAADLLRSLVEFNIQANSKLYLTGVFFFGCRYTGNDMEPLAYSTYEMGCTLSDNYSYLDQSSEELLAKGDGGTRQIHSFSKIGEDNKINTPPDDYIPDKVGEVDFSKIREQRSNEINKHYGSFRDFTL